jgi:hypothetical protein
LRLFDLSESLLGSPFADLVRKQRPELGERPSAPRARLFLLLCLCLCLCLWGVSETFLKRFNLLRPVFLHPFRGAIGLKLPFFPFGYAAVLNTTDCRQRATNGLQFGTFTAQEICHLGIIDAEAPTIIELSRAFEYCAPHPHHALNRLLRHQRRAHELFIAHHPGIVAKPPAHDRPSK